MAVVTGCLVSLQEGRAGKNKTVSMNIVILSAQRLKWRYPVLNLQLQISSITQDLKLQIVVMLRRLLWRHRKRQK